MGLLLSSLCAAASYLRNDTKTKKVSYDFLYKTNLRLHSMKNISIAFAILLFYFSSTAQSTSPVKMHRIQDTTKDKSGLYYGKSTEGHFSVLLPIPFNDFTIKTDEATSYVIGSKSEEGIKFSVTEIVKKEKNKAIDLDALLKGFSSSSSKVENVRKEKTKYSESISFSVVDKSKGAIFKYINTQNSLFTMIIEFPIAYKKTVEDEFRYFFSSLSITSQ